MKVVRMHTILLIVFACGFFMPSISVAHIQTMQSEHISATSIDGPIKGIKPIKQKLRQFKAKLQRRIQNDKANLAVLTITLGIFGGHRLYLGTEAHVPVLYTVTLGGGLGIVPIVDLICILGTKDLDKYVDDPRFIMW